MPQQPAIGQDVTALMPKIGEDVTALMASHEPEQKRPEQILAESDPNYVGDDPELGKRALERAPMVGGMAGSMFGGPLGAAAGGAAGSLVRGDSLGQAAIEGGKQGLLEGAGGLVMRGGRAVAHGLMRGTVPKNIAKDFAETDIAGTMLDRGIVPGSEMSARRVGRMSEAANTELGAAASTVPNMPRSKVIEGLRPLHKKGVTGKSPEMSDATLEQMRKSAREIGPSGLSGEGALARKQIKQAEGSAAIGSSDKRTAAFGSQLAEAEGKAIASHMRETPRMASALNESQGMMAIDDVMKDAAHSNPVTRARIGGPMAAALSPIGLGATAHVVNQGRKVANPQLMRLMDLILGGGEQ